MFAFAEFLNGFGAERGNIFGITAGYESLIADAFLIDPCGSGIFQIRLQAGPRGHFCILLRFFDRPQFIPPRAQISKV